MSTPDPKIKAYWLRHGIKPEEVVLAGLKSGHRGTAELALILAGYPLPCPACDYLVSGCQCHNQGKGTE